MTMPFYVSPEQVMKDRADYARKGIARGRSVVAIAYDGGILFVAENPSRTLHKISEIYDRIAFAGVGKYNEFENLRIAGVRYADLRATPTTARTSPAAAWPTCTPRPSARSSPTSSSRTRSRSSSPRSARPPTTTRSTASPTTARWPTSTASSPWAARPRRSPRRCRSATATACRCRRRSRLAVELLGRDPATGEQRSPDRDPARGGGARARAPPAQVPPARRRPPWPAARAAPREPGRSRRALTSARARRPTTLAGGSHEPPGPDGEPSEGE